MSIFSVEQEVVGEADPVIPVALGGDGEEGEAGRAVVG